MAPMPSLDLPEWLSAMLRATDLLAVGGESTTVASFLDAYTLHDSYWIALLSDGWAAHLVIRFDAFWTGGRVPHPGPVVAEWPILVLTLPRLARVELDLQDAGIGEAISVPHEADNGLVTTLIHDHVGGSAELVHSMNIQVHCFDSEGTSLPLAPGAMNPES